TQHFPKSGWVEHEPEDIWTSTKASIRAALDGAGLRPSEIDTIGITNQRETTLVWDRKSGKPIGRAIVWQDRRTADTCARLKDTTEEADVTAKSGLLLDPYFSSTKVAWLLDNIDGARARAEAGELAFGTVDSYLIWRLTGGKRHVTDATNASRTNLYNIATGDWDDDLLALFNVPRSVLPEVVDCIADFGTTDAEVFGAAVPIRGVAGDQQAATVGQACFAPGMMKSTYGTGCFALLNTGPDRIISKNRMLTTVAYQLDGQPTYALEGSIFVAGAAVQWLRDGLKIIGSAEETGPLAAVADNGHHVYLVPAFVGLGAPYWDPDARASLFGMTRNTGPADLARAALECVCYQTRDLLAAMQADWPGAAAGDTVLRVDGGMVASDWTMQFLADILNAPVDRPKVGETTALGAAMLAGVGTGIFADLDEAAKVWQLERRFEPVMPEGRREALYAGWLDAVSRTLSAR
ncbi:MAG: glycerol kinase GlpK, partial [Rhodobiaceae bacterium]|nr:glycerol kinase GlpK [Rhodobiaceae bacterium]